MAADLAEGAVEGFDGVGGVDDFAEFWREVEEGRELVPVGFPTAADGGVIGIVGGAEGCKRGPGHRRCGADRPHAEAKLAELVQKYRQSAPKLSAWMEANLPEGLTVFSLPEPHRKRLRTSNMCESLNRQIKRRSRFAALFPNEASILSEISDEWETGKTYLPNHKP